MEYTKDIIMNIKYNAEKDCLELASKKSINNFRKAFVKNKVVSIIATITLFLIGVDFILIGSFINLLNKI